ncbi:hypothetical protein H257_16205 [Aphanomyces astaci]|uniref:Band 7 domain-containing protein n=2 Tax=Aphanomyces astaci TaxID=112090 RepID=W4FL63_APHAT|nr:hypothetical protein H257_16205 [Aphanomyces astaci]ETV67606.1 hypothetical protein H257_16205 [Aphanomyces astaci]KAF0754318.1 hypothetical protein AaE_005382 [Aphanomyces astaci]RQM12986.1 hypothetical protein B5M09_012211 [Aphanomyces astaci]|eukprot:XP_009842863.1 hypothetical protein H257_16205 [Aphanomyces astaci]
MVDSRTVGLIVAAAVVVFVIVTALKGIRIIKEKEVMVIERFGRFKTVLSPGCHFIIPFVDQPREHTQKYVVNVADRLTLVDKPKILTISTQNEVLDFPKQPVITRDNAAIFLDAVLQYSITSPKTYIYTVKNLPHLLSVLLQAQVRNVAGSLDVDQIIEDTAQMDRVSGLMDAAAVQYGVKIAMVKIQRVDAGALSQVLAKKKQADLNNKEIIIQAKAMKQTTVINSEGNRDRMIKESEGEAQQTLSRARGEAQAIVNAATAEARSIKEISKVVSRSGENPLRYLLALKYIDVMSQVLSLKQTEVQLMPFETTFLQTIRGLGLNTVAPRVV